MLNANPDIKGIIIGREEYKVTAYADDLLFTVSQPLISVPNLLIELNRYGELAGYKINMLKSVVMPLGFTGSLRDRVMRNFAFKLTETAINYLGVKILQDLNLVYNLNFLPMLTVNAW